MRRSRSRRPSSGGGVAVAAVPCGVGRGGVEHVHLGHARFSTALRRAAIVRRPVAMVRPTVRGGCGAWQKPVRPAADSSWSTRATGWCWLSAFGRGRWPSGRRRTTGGRGPRLAASRSSRGPRMRSSNLVPATDSRNLASCAAIHVVCSGFGGTHGSLSTYPDGLSEPKSREHAGPSMPSPSRSKAASRPIDPPSPLTPLASHSQTQLRCSVPIR